MERKTRNYEIYTKAHEKGSNYAHSYTSIHTNRSIELMKMESWTKWKIYSLMKVNHSIIQSVPKYLMPKCVGTVGSISDVTMVTSGYF